MAQSEKVHVDSPGIQTQPEPGRASSPHDNGCGDGYSSDSQRSLIGDEFSANESSQLIPSSGEPTIETLQDPSLSRSGPASGDTAERRGSSLYLVGDATASGIQPCSGPAPVCTSPSSCSNKTRLGSTSSVYTRTSYKSASSQLPPPAGEDCCLHCLLACLFCELLVFCDLLLECGPHGAGSELSCPGPACGDTDDGCPCSMECSLLEDCCSSADCLEICLECCSICFAA